MKLFQRLIAAGGLVLVTAHAAAAQLSFGSWETFEFSDDIPNTPWVDLDSELVSFEFILSVPALLKVVDGGYAGDRFEVFANGRSLGFTSEPDITALDDQGLDFDAAYADARWSKAQFTLGPGSYSITGKAVAFAPDTFAGTGAVLLTAVPEPQTWALVGAGLLVVGGLARRRANTI